MRVLVTGANGFIGHHLCRALAESGRGVVALVHVRDDRLQPLTAAGHGLAVVRGDVGDRGSLESIIRDHGPLHAVCHLAAQPPGDGPRSGANLAGTATVLSATRAAGIPRVVFTSTQSVFDFLDPDLRLPLAEDYPPAPRDAYGREKLGAEGLCRRAAEEGGLTAVALRLAGVFGPGKAAGAVYTFARHALESRAIAIDRDRRVDLLWVGDAVAAIAAALAAGPDVGGPLAERSVFHVGSGRAVGLAAVAHLAAEVAGVEPRVTVRGPGNAFCLDIERARRLLGFRPTPLRTALEGFVSDLRRQLSAEAA